MDYAREERIGNPDLFTGRKEEMAYFLKWIHNINGRKSQSTALLARRKMGKSTIMERLFNITFYKNDGIIPFYYEIKENKMWIGDFCIDFFLTFLYQYVAFKTRKTRYLKLYEKGNLDKARQVVESEGLDYFGELISGVQYSISHDQMGILWETVREAPNVIASSQGEFIVQMIDEFQFLNAKIYRDKDIKILANDLAGGYLSTAESKIAPLLVSGSWVGWLMKELNSMLPSRFRYTFIKNMPEDEAAEMLYKYSRYFEVPVTEETAYLLISLTEGSPFYISSVIRSNCPEKDLTSIDGLTRSLEFETLDDRGLIKSTWMEYISGAFPQINDRNAKYIVLHLSKHKDREFTRRQLLEDLKLDMTDAELEKKLKALVKADIIRQGQSNYDYRGVGDNIFDKVFRGVYEKEIREFDARVIKQEYYEEFMKLKKQYNILQGKYNFRKGYYAEYSILDRLLFKAYEDNELLKSITRNLPADFNFCEYERVWRYDSTPEYSKRFNVDIYARAVAPEQYSIIGEVKSRDSRKFSLEEVTAFERKLEAVKKSEQINLVIGFIFSRCGFTKEAEEYCKEKGIACSEDERWLKE